MKEYAFIVLLLNLGGGGIELFRLRNLVRQSYYDNFMPQAPITTATILNPD